MGKLLRRLGPWWATLLLLAAAAWLSRLPEPASLPDPSASGPFATPALEARVARLRPTIEAVLGLELGGPVEIHAVDQEEWAEAVLEASAPEQLEELPGMREFLVGLVGRLPFAILRASVIDERILVQPECWPEMDAQTLDRELDAVILHELVHVAQERHLESDGMDEERLPEQSLAYKALVEGHAQWVTRRAAARLGLEGARTLEYGELSEHDLHVADAGVRHHLQAIYVVQRFVYDHGERFFDALVETLGYTEAVERLFSSPPASTQEILDPSRYLSEDDDPARARAMLDRLGAAFDAQSASPGVLDLDTFLARVAGGDVGAPHLLPVLHYELTGDATGARIPSAWAPLDVLRAHVGVAVGALHGATGILQVAAHESVEGARAFREDLASAVLRAGGRCPTAGPPLDVLHVERLPASRPGLDVGALRVRREDGLGDRWLGVALFAEGPHVVLVVLEIHREAGVAWVRFAERLHDLAGRAQEPDAAPTGLPDLAEADAAVREAALLRFADEGGLAAVPHAQIETWLQELDELTGAVLLDRLRREEPAAEDALALGRRALGAGSGPFAAAGARLLGAVTEPLWDEARRVLLPALQSGDPLVRIEVLEALTVVGGGEALPRAVGEAVLADPDSRVRRALFQVAPWLFGKALDDAPFSAARVPDELDFFHTVSLRKALAYRLARDEDPTVRAAAWRGRMSRLAALVDLGLGGWFGGLGRGDLLTWAAWMQERDPRIRRLAFVSVGPSLADALWEEGIITTRPFGVQSRDRFLHIVGQGLLDPDPLLRTAALESFAALPVERTTLVPLVTPYLEDVGLATYAMRALGSLQEPEARRQAMPRVLRAYVEGHCRSGAAKALGAWGEDAADAAPFLRRGLESPFAVTRLASLGALLRIEGETSVLLRHLRTHLEHPDPGVRLEALTLLDLHDEHGPEAWELIRSSLHDVPAVRTKAMEYFQHGGDIDAEVFGVALAHLEDRPDVRNALGFYPACRVLVSVGEKDAPWLEAFRPRLFDLLEKDRVAPDVVMVPLVRGLGAREAVHPALLRWLQDDASVRRTQASQWLTEIGGPADKFLGPLRAALQLEEDADDKVDHVLALLHLDPVAEEAIDEAAALLEDPELAHYKTPNIGEALGRLGERVRPVALDLLDRVERDAERNPERAGRYMDVLEQLAPLLEGEEHRIERLTESKYRRIRYPAGNLLRELAEARQADHEEREDED